MSELAMAFPSAGALAVALLHSRRLAATVTGILLGAAGALAALLATPQETFHGLSIGIAPTAHAVLLLTFAGAGLTLLLPAAGADRVTLLGMLLAGLAIASAVAAIADPYLVALVVVLAAGLQTALPALRSLGQRMRGPAFGAVLIILGSALGAGAANSALASVSGLSMVLGIVAAVGLAPYLHDLDPRESPAASPVTWLGFLGPSLAALLVVRLLPILPPAAGAGYATGLIGVGLFNAAIGTYGKWRARDPAARWRYSFIGDWGLALVGLGLLAPTGQAGALLLLTSVLLLRLPLYLLARPALIREREPSGHALNLVAAAALAGAAPFAGFAARILLLRAATAAYWPLALVLALLMLAWLPGSVRLARSLGEPDRRLGWSITVLLVVNAVIGLYPAPLIAALGGA
jgi:hypothetical protein